MDETYTVQGADGTEYGPVEIDALRQWAIQGRIAPNAMIVPQGGGDGAPASAHPVIGPIINAPPTVRGAIPPETTGDATGGLIPYKNPPALAAYYVGIGSLVALILFPLGLVVGPIAVVLGIKGLRRRKREPEVKGAAHAWAGIVIGGLVALITLGVIVLIGVSMLAGA